MSLRICFVARNDFESKAGGDTVQYRIYDRTARLAGLTTLTWFDDRPLPDADVYHAFNIDRPLELYPKMRSVVARGRPFVISTIHHPNAWVEKYISIHSPGGPFARAVSGLPFASRTSIREPIKEVVRLFMQRRMNHVSELFPPWRSRIRWLLREAAKILVLSTEERLWLERDFGVATRDDRVAWVPNWVEGIERKPTQLESLSAFSEAPVVVVGRIETRKNVLRVARLAEALNRPILFVGRANPNEAHYRQEFESIVKRGSYVHWIPGVPRDEMGAYYLNASFLLNASYVEVSPLVDIEAISFGCPVVTTSYALHHEILPACIPTVDPYDSGALSGVLRSRPSRIQPREVVDAAASQQQLLACYSETTRT